MTMNHEQTIDLITQVLHAKGEPLRALAIAEYALSGQLRVSKLDSRIDLARFPDSYALASHLTVQTKCHIRKTPRHKCVVQQVPGGRVALGPWAAKSLKVSCIDLQPPADTQFTGLAGEYAVMSELLACDWNVAKLPHDDGTDVIATRGTDLRTVQVKTAHAINGNNYVFQVSKRADEDHASLKHYYVLVLRSIQGFRYVNDFLVLNHFLIGHLKISGAVNPGPKATWHIQVRVTDGRVDIGGVDCTDYLNRFRTTFK